MARLTSGAVASKSWMRTEVSGDISIDVLNTRADAV